MGVKNWEPCHKNIYDLTFIFFILISHLIKFYRSKVCILGLCVKVLVVGVCRDGLCEKTLGCASTSGTDCPQELCMPHSWKCSA